MQDREPVEIDATTGEVTDLPPPRGRRYRCTLDSLDDVRREMAKVYRETRSGLIDPGAGTKLCWMLERVGRVIEGSDLERRIEALEERNDT
ncbi:MAG: hypothetical protein PHT19_10385 [Methylococcus sp.]|nr:hypothetical protein [Methylococcus sp.]